MLVLVAAFVRLPAGAQAGPEVPGAPPAQPPAAAPPPAVAQEPVVRDVAGLAAAIDETYTSLREIRETLARKKVPAEIAHRLNEVERQVRAIRAERDALDLDTSSLYALDELQMKGARFDSRLTEWRTALDARVAEGTGAATTLDGMRDRWRASREALAQDEIPATLRSQMKEVEAAIAAARAEVGKRLDELIGLRGRVGAASNWLGEMRAEIDASRDVARRRLLATDAPPLWPSISAPETGSFREQFHRAWDRDRQGFEEFLVEYGHRVPFQAALFVALACVLFVLRGRSRGWEAKAEDDSQRTALRVFSRPVSAALLVTVLLTRAFYPYAPPVVYDANGLLGLVPLLLLIPRLVYARLRPAVYGLGGLFALQQLRELAPPQTLLERLMLLALSGLALAVALWVLRLAGTASREPGGRFWAAAVALLRVGAALLALSLLANVIGAVSLADLWTTATLYSAYMGIGVFAGVLILDVLGTVALRSRWARATGMIAHHGDRVRGRMRRWLRVAGVLAWLAGTLLWFRALDAAVRGLRVALSTRWSAGNVDVSLGDVATFVVSIYASLLLSRFVRFVLEEDVFPRVSMPRGVPATLSMLINYGILALGLLFALSAAGFEVSQFAIIFGALGVGIGFGLQNLVNNFISGLILVFERPVKIGDTIEVGQLMGEVRRIGIRSSTVRTFDGAEVIVPNGNLISGEVINWTLSDRVRRIKLQVGVAYGTDPQTVLDLLVETAQGHKDVLRQPRPQALFQGFGASALDFELRFWTGNFDAWPVVQSEVTVALQGALKRAGVEIPYPQQDLHLRSIHPAARRALTREDERTPSLESGGEEH